ncbi:hypothetical protein PsorP6_014811 [Peronosclerospora sorghi]|uniref:Uncharacterized protein n=1 Tax=Peronosclerospora sorghi TaxID=230839 RepID=A0ACC0VSA8_9STRA|nr:hypothetical protein PsorP6_014811 [Peronosclerospora sorghi]
MVWEDPSPLLPTAHRRSRRASAGSFREMRTETSGLSRKRVHLIPQRPLRHIPAFLLPLVVGFILGYYAQLILFFSHVRMGFTAQVLPTYESGRMETFSASVSEHTQRVVFVCNKTNWDFIGFIASPHTILFAHEDAVVPSALEESLRIVRHAGVDSYLNLHNKTVTLMNHIHAMDPRNHVLKQDDEAVIYWPHYYQCLKKCTTLESCYAGDMHVNIGDVRNTNSYVFATGGSYFLGSALLQCILEKPIFVETDGLDYGEDKTVGKMIHYSRCNAQYVSCKWFNNEEVYSPNAHIKMKKGASAAIQEGTVLLRRDQQFPQLEPDDMVRRP